MKFSAIISTIIIGVGTLIATAKSEGLPPTIPDIQVVETPPRVELYDSPDKVRQYVRDEWERRGLSGNLERFIKIGNCESGFKEDARHTNYHKDGSTSLDRGIYQINNKYHPQIHDECAFDARCNVDYALDLYERSGEAPWVCKDLI